MKDEIYNICIVGPTGVGKTKLSVILSKKLGLQCVNCDTVQFWQQVENISCSPTKNEKQQCEHLLFNILEPSKKPSLGWWMKELKKIKKSKILVGGSFFYPYSLFRGIPDLDENIVANNNNQYESNIHKNDFYRVQRHKSFFEKTGYSFENYPKKYSEKILFILLEPEKKWWEHQLSLRILENIDSWIEEWQRNSKEPNFQNIIGWREIANYMEKKYSINQLINNILLRTVQYGKKQRRFLKKLQNPMVFPVNDKVDFENIVYDILCNYNNFNK